MNFSGYTILYHIRNEELLNLHSKIIVKQKKWHLTEIQGFHYKQESKPFRFAF